MNTNHTGTDHPPCQHAGTCLADQSNTRMQELQARYHWPIVELDGWLYTTRAAVVATAGRSSGSGYLCAVKGKPIDMRLIDPALGYRLRRELRLAPHVTTLCLLNGCEAEHLLRYLRNSPNGKPASATNARDSLSRPYNILQAYRLILGWVRTEPWLSVLELLRRCRQHGIDIGKESVRPLVYLAQAGVPEPSPENGPASPPSGDPQSTRPAPAPSVGNGAWTPISAGEAPALAAVLAERGALVWVPPTALTAETLAALLPGSPTETAAPRPVSGRRSVPASTRKSQK